MGLTVASHWPCPNIGSSIGDIFISYHCDCSHRYISIHSYTIYIPTSQLIYPFNSTSQQPAVATISPPPFQHFSPTFSTWSSTSVLEISLAMEGLIPLVYRAIKGGHTRRKYQCLSVKGHEMLDPYHHGRQLGFGGSTEKMDGHHVEHFSGHRRHKSMEEYSGEFFDEPKVGGGGSVSKGGGRGSMSSRIFSCVSVV